MKSLTKSQKTYCIVVTLLSLCFPALMLFYNINVGWSTMSTIAMVIVLLLSILLPVVVIKEQKGTL